ncbi:MAG: SUMF1/EgtB/PvdO family nonheme iron enzyme, partial [Proteobacteria bacterium]|nr:SUMF1/EgtB/PvdO family nonheme iron enzyme [Pseudomonadota bacterium]
TNGEAWVSGKCAKRVLRGGSWNLNSWHLRSANRNGRPASTRINFVGFRITQNLQ